MIFSKLKKYIATHKKISIAILIVLVGGTFYFTGGSSGESVIRYVPARVELGTLETSVSGTGQIAAVTQLDISSKASGDVVYIGVKNGDEVKAGTLLVQLSTKDADKEVRDAEVTLLSAKLSLEKLLRPATDLELLQAKNDLEQAKEAKINAENSLEESYADGFNTVSNTFLDLPTIMIGLENILYDNTIKQNQDNISAYQNAVDQYEPSIEDMKDSTNNAYQQARSIYDTTFTLYNSLSRFSSNDEVIDLIEETYTATQLIAEAVKTTNNYIDFVEDVLVQKDVPVFPQTSGHQSSLDTFTNDSNNHLLDLLGIKNTIKDALETIVNAERTIAEEEISLSELEAGTDDIDIETQRLTVIQRENALQDAKENLTDYFIRALISGKVTGLNIVRGQSISSGENLGSLVTKQQIAEITLNEVDAATIEAGLSATLTLDAIEGLDISGEVVEVDVVGAVTQGVVTYGIKVAFESEDERIKPGMSVSVDITTNVKENVILVSNSAIKIDGNVSYVEVLEGFSMNTERQVDKDGTGNSASGGSEQGQRRNLTEEEQSQSGDGSRGNFAEMSEEERAQLREQFTRNGGSQGFGDNSQGSPTRDHVGTQGVVESDVPVRRTIQTGLSNDLFTEVLSGLEVGEFVVIQTISGENQAAPQQQNSILPTGRGFRGGASSGGFRDH